jgi:hypothetical protein
MTTAIFGGGTTNLDALSVAGAAAVGSLSVGGNALDATFQQLINNTSASSDVSLAIGQLAYVDVSAATSAALKIATGDNQIYELTLLMAGNGSTTVKGFLNPNNTTYTNCFAHQGMVESGGSSGANGEYISGFAISHVGDIRQSKATISTKTISKTLSYVSSTLYNGTSPYWANGVVNWLNAASNPAVTDTTTTWTSLGTVTFPVAATGRIYIRRLA